MHLMGCFVSDLGCMFKADFLSELHVGDLSQMLLYLGMGIVFKIIPNNYKSWKTVDR